MRTDRLDSFLQKEGYFKRQLEHLAANLNIVPKIPAFREHKYDETYFTDGMEVLKGLAFGDLKVVEYSKSMNEPRTVEGEEDVDGRDILYVSREEE